MWMCVGTRDPERAAASDGTGASRLAQCFLGERGEGQPHCPWRSEHLAAPRCTSPSAVIPLLNGVAMPALGYGTWQLSAADGKCYEGVSLALAAGYRHIDTARSGAKEF